MDQNSQTSDIPDTNAVSARVNHSSTHPPSLAGVIVGIPAFNEEVAIGSVVLKARQYAERVIVVDDWSPDRNSNAATSAGAEVLHPGKNKGEAHALPVGLNHARNPGCKTAVTRDGNGQHWMREIRGLV